MLRAGGILGVLLLVGCGAAVAPAAPPTGALTVATFNLNYGLAGEPETTGAIAHVDADVLLLQEVSSSWWRALPRDAWPYACVARSRYPAGGAAILSRHPLRDCRRSASAAGWFPALAGTVSAPLGEVRVINLHLRPARGGAAAFADLAALPDAHRREVAQHLARLSEPGLPTVLGGDFNEGDGEGALSTLSSRGYASALAQHQPSAVTWGWPVGLMRIEKRLDHLLFDPRALRCADARVLEVGRSDHRPVVARFVAPRPSPLPIGGGLLSGRPATSALAPR